jgi:hypothetical protein
LTVELYGPFDGRSRRTVCPPAATEGEGDTNSRQQEPQSARTNKRDWREKSSVRKHECQTTPASETKGIPAQARRPKGTTSGKNDSSTGAAPALPGWRPGKCERRLPRVRQGCNNAGPTLRQNRV